MNKINICTKCYHRSFETKCPYCDIEMTPILTYIESKEQKEGIIYIGTAVLINEADQTMFQGRPVELVIFENQLRYLNPYNCNASRIKKGYLLRDVKIGRRD